MTHHRPRTACSAVRAIAIAVAVATPIVAALDTPAFAQPAGGDKVDAKALMASGLKLLEAKDYLGALAVFKDAYSRFPSPRILLNIGTTYKLLGREADAANAYQRYLDSDDKDTKRRADITKLLAEIDKTVGIVELSVAPLEADVQVGGDDWMPASAIKLARVPAGKIALKARLDGYEPKTTSAQVGGGERVAIEIHLSAVPKAAPQIVTVTVPSGIATTAHGAEPGSRSRIGVIALGHVDIPHGWAPLVGIDADITPRIQVDAAAIVGVFKGAYVGARFAVLPGSYRPFVAAGVPVFSSNGARWEARAAGGIELEINRYVAVIVEAGYVRAFNPEMGKPKNMFVPALGVSGRL
jgi:hypothetical protein